jgi:hypothetical protein
MIIFVESYKVISRELIYLTIKRFITDSQVKELLRFENYRK